MILEFVAENFTKVPEAIELGAKRIELCDNLAEDGTTPSHAVIEHTIEYVKNTNAKVAVMIRPRSGDFVYSADEFTIMEKDLIVAKVLGADALIIGSLTEEKRVNRKHITRLLAHSDKTDTVFHMAFDHIDKEYQKEELDWLAKQGITRILTHGGVGGAVEDHIEWLQELIAYADGRIEIIVGGGVTHRNYKDLAKALPATQFQGIKIVDFVD